MGDCNKCRAMFSEFLYGELPDKKRKILEDHLNTCWLCRSELDELTKTQALMEKRVRPEPGPEFWDNYWDKLARRMDKEEILFPDREKRWKSFLRLAPAMPRWAYQSAAAVILIVVGIFIGRLVFTPDNARVSTADLGTGSADSGLGIELVQRTQNYIDRSKTMLLAIVNFDQENDDPYALSLPYQRQVSQELVQEAVWIKAGLADSKERRLQELVSDLEVILLQIANLEAESDLEAIELVKDGVENRGILLKINLADMRRSTEQKNKAKSF